MAIAEKAGVFICQSLLTTLNTSTEVGRVNFYMAMGLTALVITLLATVRGISLITKDQRWQPNPTTWWIWAATNVLGMYHSYRLGAWETLPTIGAYFLADCTIAILATRAAKAKWSTFDKWSAAGATVSLVTVLRLGLSGVGLVFALLASSIATLPTFRSAAITPEKESPAMWAVYLLAAVFQTAAVRVWSWAEWGIAAGPALGLIGNIIILSFVLWPRRHAT